MSDEQQVSGNESSATTTNRTLYNWQSREDTTRQGAYSWATTIGERREGFRALPVPAITQPLPPPAKLPVVDLAPECRHIERLADIKGEYRSFLLGMILFFAFVALANTFLFFSSFSFVTLVAAVGSISVCCVAHWKRAILTETDDS